MAGHMSLLSRWASADLRRNRGPDRLNPLLYCALPPSAGQSLPDGLIWPAKGAYDSFKPTQLRRKTPHSLDLGRRISLARFLLCTRLP